MIKVNTNCGKSAGTVKYISLDGRFDEQKAYNTRHDPRINRKPVTRRHRANRIALIPQFSFREWIILIGILFLIFITYCSIVYK